jgi:hypothetical protein
MPKSMLVLLAALVAVPLIAQSTTKPAWQVPVEERISRRTNAGLALERARTGKRMQTAAVQSRSGETRPVADAFDGQTHPELFLPFEVFRKLVSVAFYGPPHTCQLVREGHMDEVRRHGLPEDFWQRLEAISAIHVADLWAMDDLSTAVREARGAARKRAEDALALKHDDICRSRADALAAARQEFGRERFDRFLYESIAVNMFHVSDRLPQPELLRKIEGGCR